MRGAALPLVVALALAAAAARGAEFGVALDAPAPGAETSLGWIELRGRAGSAAPRGHDVVLALDLSDSTTAPAGVDLDRDGPGGRTSPELLAAVRAEGADGALLRRLEGRDLDDSVLFAELAAAEVLIGRLDPAAFRVGIVAFSDGARVVAPLGTPAPGLRAALARLRREFWRDLRGTNFAAAIRAATEELAPPDADARAPTPGTAPPVGGGPRVRSLLLLSDGVPTLPPHGDRPQQFAIEAAQDAALAGIRIYAYALGAEAAPGLDVFRAVAATTGGRFERIERPADAIARLRGVDLARLASLDIVNETTGQEARALRTFPDGSFDAFLPLEPGTNRLRVLAVAADGTRAVARREIAFRPPAGGDLSEALRAEQRALLDELRRRTREVELWAEIERGRAVPLRELELEAVAPAPPP